jgi:hypothetical protein
VRYINVYYYYYYYLCNPGVGVKTHHNSSLVLFLVGQKDLVARTTVCLPKSRGGFGVIYFERKAESFALQWVKRFFAPERAKWKSFLKIFITSCLGRSPQEAFEHIHPSRLMNALPPFYRIIFRTWRALDGDRAGDELALQASSDVPLPVSQFSSCNTYRLGQQKRYREPNCILHFYGDYGPLHWPQTWAQLHITTLDRFVIDLNWKIARGVLYTGSRLKHDFGMAHIDPQCFCGADEETLEHLFFECRVARIVTGWIFFNLLQVDPTANKFTVDELLFGFTTERRRKIPLVIVWMLHTMKHIIWVARFDYRFRGKMPVESECLNKLIV